MAKAQQNQVKIYSGFLFSARTTSGQLNVTGDGTKYDVIYDQEDIDEGGNFNIATGIATIPVDGIYQFDVSITADGLTSTNGIFECDLFSASLGDIASIAIFDSANFSGGVAAASGSTTFKLLATDDMRVRLSVTGVALNVSIVSAIFSGKLIRDLS